MIVGLRDFNVPSAKIKQTCIEVGAPSLDGDADLLISATALSGAFGTVMTFAMSVQLSRKLTSGKRHIAEHTAGIVLLHRNTLLFGNRIFGGIDQILGRSDNADHREDPQRNREESVHTGVVKANRRVQNLNKLFGHIAATAAVAIGGSLKDLASQKDRIHHLNHSGGNVSATVAGFGIAAEAARLLGGTENIHIAFASIEDHTLFRNNDPLNLLGASAANANLKHNLNIESHRNGIKTSIESDRINGNIAPKDLRALCAHSTSMLQKLISVVGEIHTGIFVAIPIPTSIQNSIGFNANGIPAGAGRTRESVFRHNRYSPFHK